MLNVLGGLTLALAPFAIVTVLLLFASRMQARRQELIARQISVTDAVDREFGVVVAPTMRQTLLGPPELVIPVPLARAEFVGRVVETAHRTLRALDGSEAARVRIVLTPQEQPRAA